MTICNEVGYLIANGKRVATLRCGEEAGHTLERPANHRLMQPIPGTPHVARLEWEEPAREIVDDWPERYDADEKHDVEVPMLDPGTLGRISTRLGIESRLAQEDFDDAHDEALLIDPPDAGAEMLARANATIRRLRRAVMRLSPDEEEFDALLAQVVAETAHVDRMIDGRREGD